MNWELKKKLANEQHLSVEEALRLDQALEAESNVSALMKSLEDEAPSLAWRSALNEKLIASTGRRKRTYAVRWVSGFAATAAVAIFAFVSLPRVNPIATDYQPQNTVKTVKSTGLEESLLTAHMEADIESGLGVSTESATMSPAGS